MQSSHVSNQAYFKNALRSVTNKVIMTVSFCLDSTISTSSCWRSNSNNSSRLVSSHRQLPVAPRGWAPSGARTHTSHLSAFILKGKIQFLFCFVLAFHFNPGLDSVFSKYLMLIYCTCYDAKKMFTTYFLMTNFCTTVGGGGGGKQILILVLI